MRRGGTALALAAVALLTIVPIAASDYCPPTLRVYGRATPLPGVVPPDEPLRVECAREIEAIETFEHTLAPGSTQITMRVYGDLAERRLAVELDGLGWRHNKVWLDRYTTPTVYYAIEWLYMPEPAAEDGTLTASIKFPHRPEQVVVYERFPLDVQTNVGRP